MSGGIPSGAVGASVAVLVYSVICFTLCFLLVLLLLSFGERWTYVTIFSAFTALSTFASILQQLHYATAWEVIKQAEFNKALASRKHKGLALGGAAQIVDQVLFFIQFYCYNVMGLNMLFWTIALFTGSWGIRAKWMGEYTEWVSPAAKKFSVVFPGLIVGLLNVPTIQDSEAGFIIVSYIAMFSSLSTGSILLILILYKYMKTRRLVTGYAKRGRWWVSDSRSRRDVGADYTAETAASRVPSSTRRSIYDKALITRFTIGFVLMAVFQVAIIIYTLIQANNAAGIIAAGRPDLSLGGTISEILLFIPGVTASLVAFLLFGTTKSWRQYRDLVVGRCGVKRAIIKKKTRVSLESTHPPQGIEFERLPSLHNTPSQEERQKGKDTESRVRMFVKDAIPQDSDSLSDIVSIGPIVTAPPSSTIPSLASPGRISSPSETHVVQFNRPRPVVPPNGRNTSDVGLDPHNERQDSVKQHGRQNWGKFEQSERDRRFVEEHLSREQNFLELDSSNEALSNG